MAALPPMNRRAARSLRAFYFLRYAAAACIVTFLSLFFHRKGLTGAQIGVLTTIGAGIALVAAPLWGRIGDATGRALRLIAIGLAGSSLVYAIMSQQSLYGWLALLVAVEAGCSAAITPLSDAFSVGVAGGERFGGVRLWGSLGWAVMTLVSGWTVQQLGILTIFAEYVALNLLALLAVMWLARLHSAPAQADRPPLRFLDAARALLHDRTLMGLMAVLSVSQVLMAGIGPFEPIFLDRLGAHETLIGLLYTIAALVELPAMLLADRLAARYGAARILMWGMLWGVARYGLVLAFPTVPVIVFGSSLLRGFFMGFRIVGLTVFVAQHAPKFQASTALALFTVTLANLSNLVGGPLAGVVFDTVGGYWIYVLAAVGLAITTLVLATMPIGNWRHALYAGRHALEIEQ